MVSGENWQFSVLNGSMKRLKSTSFTFLMSSKNVHMERTEVFTKFQVASLKNNPSRIHRFTTRLFCPQDTHMQEMVT